jgi:hypothetical protein
MDGFRLEYYQKGSSKTKVHETQNRLTKGSVCLKMNPLAIFKSKKSENVQSSFIYKDKKETSVKVVVLTICW